MEHAAHDIFATKGIEYLLVIGYLLLLVPAWMVLSKQRPRELAEQALRLPARAAGTLAGWLGLPEGYLFHRGHGWAAPEGDGVLRLGIDRFAQRLVGGPDALKLPEVGDELRQGALGWRLGVAGEDVDMLAPADGEVIAVNEEALARPELVAEDPFGAGWLVKVRTSDPAATSKNLLSDELAASWMDGVVAGLGERIGGGLGVVLADGGVPVDGFARQLAPERWKEVAAELLLTDDAGEAVQPTDS